MSTEEKPEVKAEGGKHSITIVLKDGEELKLMLKTHTKMEKVYNAVATNRGLERNSFKITHNGRILNDTDTPKSLEFEEEEQLDVQMAQIGGGASP